MRDRVAAFPLDTRPAGGCLLDATESRQPVDHCQTGIHNRPHPSRVQCIPAPHDAGKTSAYIPQAAAANPQRFYQAWNFRSNVPDQATHRVALRGGVENRLQSRQGQKSCGT